MNVLLESLQSLQASNTLLNLLTYYTVFCLYIQQVIFEVGICLMVIVHHYNTQPKAWQSLVTLRCTS